MRPNLLGNRGFVAAGAVVVSLVIAGPTQASTAGAGPQCKGAMHRLAQDKKRHAPPPVIKRDQQRVKQYCH